MARRVALALLALALVAASVAHAATSPATSKGKKGKGGGSSTCPNAASCGLATVAQVATLSLYNREYSDFFTSTLTLDSTNPQNSCDVTDSEGDAPTDWTVNCRESTEYPPRTLDVKVTCPVDASGALGSMTQFYCEAYITDGAGSIIAGLPTYTSGFWGDEAVCMVDTSALSDGQTVSIGTGVECSNYVALLDGAKTAAKAKLSKFIKKN
jgi:hypothetical protein